MKTNIIFSLQAEGWHAWNDAPSEYSYLANRHRHVFHIKCALGVTDTNREIEIIDAKFELQQWIHATYPNYKEMHGCDFKGMSCEFIATRIAQHLIERYGKRFCKVSVMEDGENGASVML